MLVNTYSACNAKRENEFISEWIAELKILFHKFSSMNGNVFETFCAALYTTYVIFTHQIIHHINYIYNRSQITLVFFVLQKPSSSLTCL